MMTNDWVKQLELEKHPEGGYFREVYRSTIQVPFPGFKNDRAISTSIFYLLENEQVSKFHRIKSDEIWHFYDGTTLIVYEITEDGELIKHRLGTKIELGDSPQVVVKANRWFGAMLEDKTSFALCGCTVAPGFDFEDFEMGQAEKLNQDYPKHKAIIDQLT